MRDIDDWRPALSTALNRWSEFVALVRHRSRVLYDADEPDRASPDMEVMMAHLVDEQRPVYFHSSVNRADRIDDVLRTYLQYVHATLTLARVLNVPFYDWYDYQPFYERKLSGKSKLAAAQDQQIHRLFDVVFPEFVIKSPRQLLRLLQDRRIGELRGLVSAAARGEVVFDRDFAVRTLLEVVAREQAIGRYRSIVSYAAFPVGLVPTLGNILQKTAEEAVSIPYERVTRAPLSWFYLLSEARRGE